MKRNFVMMVVAVVTILSLTIISCAAPAPAPTPAPSPAEESFTIKLNAPDPEGDECCEFAFRPWGPYVEKATEGRVTVDFFPGAGLWTWGETLTALEGGVGDMGITWNPAYPGRLPLWSLWSLPGLAGNQSTANSAMMDIVDKYPQFKEEFGDKVEYIYSNVNMRSDIHSVKPIRSLEELKGKVIACTNEMGANAMKQLGASPTQISTAPEAYLACQRGVVDGAFAAWGWVRAISLNEVAPYHTLLALCPGTTTGLMRKATWDRLTSHEQDMLKAYRFEGIRNMVKGNCLQSLSAREGVPEENYIHWSMEDMAKVKTLFQPAWDEWVEEMEALGYPARDILEDTIRLMDGYTYA